MKAAAVLVFSSPLLSLFAGTPPVKVPAEPNAALSDLLSGASLGSCAQLPAVSGIQVPAAAVEKDAARNVGPAPEPGRDFTPVIEDAARVRAIMKLIADIYQGSHLPYAQDGATFTNKEGRLPAQPLGFYKEYTLLTGAAPHTVTIGGVAYQVAPDLSARGSERVIIGGGEKIYYTPDHYAHFIQLAVVY